MGAGSVKITYNDVMSAKMWAEAHHGDDSVADVMAHKLLELIAESHEGNAGYHERSAAEARKLMAEIESRFVVSGSEEF